MLGTEETSEDHLNFKTDLTLYESLNALCINFAFDSDICCTKLKHSLCKIKHNNNTSIKRPISGQSTPMVTGCMEMGLI